MFLAFITVAVTVAVMATVVSNIRNDIELNVLILLVVDLLNCSWVKQNVFMVANWCCKIYSR